MIEAVNSVIANAPLVRGNAEQASNAASFASDTQQVREVSQAPRAPFISLVTIVDNDFDTAVFAFRDSDTGDILRQFPTETRLAQLARQASAPVEAPSSNASGALIQPSEPSSSPIQQSAPVFEAPVQSAPQPQSGQAEFQIATAALNTAAAQGTPTSLSVTA